MSLTLSEAKKLIASSYPEVRQWTVESGPFSPRRLKKFCRKAPNPSVRGAAWERIKGDLTETDFKTYSGSQHVDVRLHVAAHPETPEIILYFLSHDGNQSVRQAALPRIVASLNLEGLEYFSLSEYDDVRLIIAANPQTPRAMLLKLCDDRVQSVSQKAVSRVLENAAFKELRLLHSSQFDDVRLAVAAHSQTPRELLLTLCDNQAESVREKALPRIMANATVEELENFHSSRYADVRLAVSAHPRTPRTILLKLAKDSDPEVRQKALPRVLTTEIHQEELEELTTGYDDAKLAVAVHPLTSKDVLLNLSFDGNQKVREKALPRVLQDATLEDFRRLIETYHVDVRLALAMHHQTPKGILRRLAKDREPEVKKAALAKLKKG